MSRAAFGGWGWQLSDAEFGRAIATLRVLDRDLGDAWVARARRGRPSRASRRTESPDAVLASTALEALVRQARNSDQFLVPWRPRSLRRLKAMMVGSGLTPGVLSEIWTTTRAEGIGADSLALQIRPVRGLDLAWTYGVLANATSQRTPYVSIAEPSGRLRWNWPMRVGFLPTEGYLRGELYEGTGKPSAT